MHSRPDYPENDAVDLPAADRNGDQFHRRGQRIVAWAIAAGAGALLLAVGALAYRRCYVPQLPPPNRPALRQPGGILRQVTSADVRFADWSSDGKHLAIIADDSDHPWRYLGLVKWYRMRKALTLEPLGPELCYLSVVSADGAKSRSVRLPQGWSTRYCLWRPGGSLIAVNASKIEFVEDELAIRQGAWGYDVRRGGFSQLGGGIEPLCWSPDGRYLAGRSMVRFPYQGYFVGAAPDWKARDIPAPPQPYDIDRPCWSPDSRLLAFRCHERKSAQGGRKREWQIVGIWIVDVKTRETRLIRTGEITRVVWLSDGRLAIMGSDRAEDGQPLARMGVAKPGTGRVQWLAWRLPYICTGGAEARGLLVLRLTRGIDRKDGQAHYDLYELSLSDGGLRRLTDIGSVRGWRLSPKGDKIAFFREGLEPLPGLWVLDIHRRAEAASGGAHPIAPR